MSIAYILSFIFFYLALALIFYSLCITGSEVDDIIEKQNSQYWHIEYNTQGGEQDAN